MASKFSTTQMSPLGQRYKSRLGDFDANDLDGTGPLHFAGTLKGSRHSYKVVQYNSTSNELKATPLGFNGSPLASVVWEDKLILGGSWNVAGNREKGFKTNSLIAWDGYKYCEVVAGGVEDPSNASPLAGFTNGVVRGLTVYSGNLIVCGDFTKIGGLSFSYMVQITPGGTISYVGGVAPSGEVLNVTVAGGDLYALGVGTSGIVTPGASTARFDFIGATRVNGITNFDGASWNAINGPSASAEDAGVSGTATDAVFFSSDLHISGRISQAGGFTYSGTVTGLKHNATRWLKWQAGGEPDFPVGVQGDALAVYSSKLYILGNVIGRIGGSGGSVADEAEGLLTWDGSVGGRPAEGAGLEWASDSRGHLLESGGKLYVAGSFSGSKESSFYPNDPKILSDNLIAVNGSSFETIDQEGTLSSMYTIASFTPAV